MHFRNFAVGFVAGSVLTVVAITAWAINTAAARARLEYEDSQVNKVFSGHGPDPMYAYRPMGWKR